MLLANSPLSLALLSLLGRAVTAGNIQAYSLAPTGNWDGNDGGWSTFAIRVGTPPQFFRILPSTGGTGIYIPLPDNCTSNSALCGSARGVEPFNAAPAKSSVLSGTPSNVNGTSVDPGGTCTINRSPTCSECENANGKCTSGACNGRQCCGTLSACISSCMGLAGICTGQFIGCPCTGPDYNAGPGVMATTSTNPSLALGYQYNVSSSWATGSKTQPISGLPLTLGIHDNGLYGIETVGIGADVNNGLTMQGQNVVGVNASSLYIGSLGLSMGTDNSSILETLFNQNMTPSISYGYTAGALYQQPPVLGSFTLGGYDSARINPAQNLTSNLRSNDSSVMVGIGAITLANALAPITTLLSIENNLTALIDTTLPYIYLPLYVCQQLEQAFGLQWDATHDMYLISDTTHQQLLKAGPSITFTLSATLPEPTALNVTIPYAAFDLTAAYPIFPNGTNYFPLRRANNSAQFVLGRAFMQEAYLFVDYQTSQFTISQAVFPATGAQNLVTIDHTTGSATSSASPGNSNIMSVGAIAGIAVGASIGIVLVCTIAWLVWRSRSPKRRRRQGDVWRAPVSKGPSANSSGSSGPEKSILTTSTSGYTNPSRYSPPPAFTAYRSDQTQSRALSDYQRMSQSTSTQSPNSSGGKFKMPWRSPGHSRKSSSTSKDVRNVRISYPTAPLHNGKAMLDVDNPWQTSALDPPPPTKTKKATPPTGHTRMFSILDETDKPADTNALPHSRAPSNKRPGLPKLNTAQEMYRPPKEWETPKEWDTMDVGWSPSPISPERPTLARSSSSKRPSYYSSTSSSRQRQDSFNTIIVDSEAQSSSTKHGSRPSVGSEASKVRQKHIWEMQSPGGSRGASPSPSRHHHYHRSRTSGGTSGTSSGGGMIQQQPSIPEIPVSGNSPVSSAAPTPSVSPGPEGRRRHIWELQSPGGSRGNSRKHSRTGTRDLTRDGVGGDGHAAVVADHALSPMPGTAI